MSGGGPESPRPLVRQIRLASRPDGPCAPSDFTHVETTLAEVEPGEVSLRVIYLSLEPYVRGRMDARPSYSEPMDLGDVIDGVAICEVMESKHPGIEPGDLVSARAGWQSHAVVSGRAVRRLDARVLSARSLTAALGVLGMPGFTAYAGLQVIGRPRRDDTVVVAAATGPVGSLVGQLARLQGARVVGIAGGPVKRALLTDKLGFDVALDHRAPDFSGALGQAVPEGIDVYFENVGGHVMDAVLPHLNKGARVPVCGLIAGYDSGIEPGDHDRLPGFMRDVLDKSLEVRGFLASQFASDHFEQFLDDVSGWLANGSITYLEDVVDGLENAPEAFIGMLSGTNLGKLVIRVGPEPTPTGGRGELTAEC